MLLTPLGSFQNLPADVNSGFGPVLCRSCLLCGPSMCWLSAETWVCTTGHISEHWMSTSISAENSHWLCLRHMLFSHKLPNTLFTREPRHRLGFLFKLVVLGSIYRLYFKIPQNYPSDPTHADCIYALLQRGCSTRYLGFDISGLETCPLYPLLTGKRARR